MLFGDIQIFLLANLSAYFPIKTQWGQAQWLLIAAEAQIKL